MAAFTDYFQDLGFYRNEVNLGPSIRAKRNKWTAIVYALLVTGIFGRQITNFPKVSMNFHNLNFSVFFASLIIGFAILPYVIRKITASNPKPALEHTLTAFGIGFFIDFASSALLGFFS
jgi:hypothetical protein